MSSATLLRSARLNSGLSQRALAKECNVSQPAIARVESAVEQATVERLESWLRPLGSRITIVPFRTPTVYEIAEVIRKDLAANHFNHAFRAVIQLSDNFDAIDPATRVAIAITPPAPTGDTRFDALLAGLVEFKLDRAHLPRPIWLSDFRFFLDTPWDVEQLPQLQEEARRLTPEQFFRHGVFIDPINFASV
jgi:transcriptional regulator with XRE-family HTH domain